MKRWKAVEWLYWHRRRERWRQATLAEFPSDPPSSGLTFKAFLSMLFHGGNWGG